jgi:hypothetical protein
MCPSSGSSHRPRLPDPKLLCIASVLPFLPLLAVLARAVRNQKNQTTFINRLLCHMGEGKKHHHHHYHRASYVARYTHPHPYTHVAIRAIRLCAPASSAKVVIFGREFVKPGIHPPPPCVHVACLLCAWCPLGSRKPFVCFLGGQLFWNAEEEEEEEEEEGIGGSRNSRRRRRRSSSSRSSRADRRDGEKEKGGKGGTCSSPSFSGS